DPGDAPQVAVEDASRALVIVVARLHHPVARTKDARAGGDRRPAIRVQSFLQRLVQRVHARRATIDWRKHLNIAQWIKAVARGQPPRDEIHDQALRAERVLLAQKKEVSVRVAVQSRHFAGVDAVRRYNHRALTRLTKQLGEVCRGNALAG